MEIFLLENKPSKHGSSLQKPYMYATTESRFQQ